MVRIKRRYIVAQISGKKGHEVFQDHDILNGISDHVAQAYGDFGVGCLKRNFSMKKNDHSSGCIIIQVRKGVHEMVMSVLPLISKFSDTPCQVNIIHLSGTIRSSLKHLQRRYIMNLRASIAKKIETEAEKKAVAEAKMQ